jgi:hypothetical protein
MEQQGIASRGERRAPDRLKLRPCEKCARADLAVVLRTALAIYARCQLCGHIRPIPKPRAPLQASRERIADASAG